MSPKHEVCWEWITRQPITFLFKKVLRTDLLRPWFLKHLVRFRETLELSFGTETCMWGKKGKQASLHLCWFPNIYSHLGILNYFSHFELVSVRKVFTFLRRKQVVKRCWANLEPCWISSMVHFINSLHSGQSCQQGSISSTRSILYVKYLLVHTS